MCRLRRTLSAQTSASGASAITSPVRLLSVIRPRSIGAEVGFGREAGQTWWAGAHAGASPHERRARACQARRGATQLRHRLRQYLASACRTRSPWIKKRGPLMRASFARSGGDGGCYVISGRGRIRNGECIVQVSKSSSAIMAVMLAIRAKAIGSLLRERVGPTDAYRLRSRVTGQCSASHERAVGALCHTTLRPLF